MIIVTLFAVAMLLTAGWRSFTKVHAFSKSFEDQWETPPEIKAAFGAASIVGSNRVVFNICGNKVSTTGALHEKCLRGRETSET